jgi:hypothetical protein
MLRLFRPQILHLLQERDAVVANWQERHPDVDVFEDRRLDLPSRIKISLHRQVRAIQAALDARGCVSGSEFRQTRFAVPDQVTRKQKPRIETRP